MRRTPGTPNEHVSRNRGRHGTAAAGLLAALLLLASCGSSAGPSADAASESELGAAAERIVEPDLGCAPAPTSLSAAMAVEANGTECFFTAPFTITAEVPGTIDLLISAAPATCTVDVLNTDGSTIRSLSVDSSDTESALALDAGEGVTLSDADGTCRFQVSWTPLPAASTTSTTTTAAPTTTTSTTTTSTTTTTTTTTTKPTPPPTTTSAVGS